MPTLLWALVGVWGLLSPGAMATEGVKGGLPAVKGTEGKIWPQPQMQVSGDAFMELDTAKFRCAYFYH